MSEARVYRCVTVKHPGCGVPYTFRVPSGMDLKVGDYVLCKVNGRKIPQVAMCITDVFSIADFQLESFYGFKADKLSPVVGILKPVMYAYEAGDGE